MRHPAACDPVALAGTTPAHAFPDAGALIMKSRFALTLLVLPALYRTFAEQEAAKEHAPEWV